MLKLGKSMQEGGMIHMADVEVIRKQYYVHQKSIRQISRELGHTRKTIRKVLFGDGGPPRYNRHKPYPEPVLGPYKKTIRQWLEEDGRRPRKQRHTAKRVYDRLEKECNFQGTYSAIRKYIARYKKEKMRKQMEVFIPLEFSPGENAQCDWEEAEVFIGGKLEVARLFHIKLSYSRMPFCMSFPIQRQEAFFEGHKEAFKFYGGVPKEITYDNLKVVVKRILEGRDREEQEAFTHFRSHYLFDSYFCSRGRGNEKGRVENSIKYERRNWLVPRPHLGSWEELNAYLREKCLEEGERNHPEKRDKKIKEMFEEEKRHLLPLPEYDFDCYRHKETFVSSTSQVIFDRNKYSVPCEYVGRPVTVKGYAWRVVIIYGDTVIAEYKRTYGKGEEIFTPEHYLPVLERKPGAFRDGKPFKGWDLPESFYAFYRKAKKNPKEFILVLGLLKEYTKEEIGKALKKAMDYGVLRYEVVKGILYQMKEEVREPEVMGDDFSSMEVRIPQLEEYDNLLKM